MEERHDNNENKVKDEKTLRSEWLLLLLSIIILILLLLLLLVAGINYYKMERKGIFKVSGNTIYFGEESLPGEVSEEFEAIIEDIDSLPSIKDISEINDPDVIHALIEKIRSILSEAEKLSDGEKVYFDAIYKDRLNELLDALLKRAKQLSDGLAPDENYPTALYGPSEAETGGDSGKSHAKTDTGGPGGGGGSGKGKGKDKKEEPPQITVTPDDGSAGDRFSITIDGSLYPGDSKSRSYTIDLTYSGDRKLLISIPAENIDEEATGLSELLDCEVKIDDEIIYPKAGGSHKLRDMEAEYALPHADNTKKLSKKCNITVTVPTTLNDDSSLENSYQGKKITDFAINWQIR